MARCLFPAHGMFFTFYLILGALTPIELQHLDQECLKYNFASFGPTNQSSNWNASSVASKAVDGDHKTCSQTAETNNTWWQVDLIKEINVSLIQVTNSPKYPLVIRITVSKHMNQNGSSCGVKHILEGGETRWIVCVPHIFGRYVKIQPGDKYKSLSLCEVQVFDQTVKLTEGVIYKAWFNVESHPNGWSLQSLYNHEAYKSDKPDSQGVLSTFQSPRNITDHYGIVMITYYNAPETGNYTFYMSGDDNSKLLKGKLEVAAIPTRNGKNKDAEFTPFEEWNGSISKPQLFEKDKVYMLTGQMKENGGLDHLRVSVRLPNGHYEVPMKHRLFTSKNAAQERSTNNCNSTSGRYCRCDDEECRKRTRDKPTDICNKTTTTQKLSNLYQSLLNGKTSPINTSKELVKLTSNTTEFVPDDLALITLTLENIVDNTAVLNETGPNIMKTVNNILNVQTNVIGDSERNNQSSNRILFVISKYLGNVPIKRGKNVSQDEGNIAVYAQDWNVTQFQGVRLSSLEDLKNKDNGFIVLDDNPTDVSQPSDTQVSLTIPKTSLEIKTATEQRLFFVVYRKTTLFQSKGRNSSYSNAKTVKKMNSFVISATVKGQALQNLTEPVQCVYHPLEKGINESTECVFWDFKLKNGQGDWSGDGCYYKGTDNGLVTCHCFHLTNFAILVDIYIDDHNDGVHDKALSIISYIGCAVSLFGLVLMIITILLFKDLRSQAPTQILLNFCIALSLTLIVFLTAAERSKTSSMVACRAAAVALHYFVLVVFMWMAIQAFNMFLAFVVVMHKYYSRFILKCCIAGWGIPAIIVIITAATSMDYYGDEHFCRVKGLPFFVAFLAPVLVILLGNIIAFVLIFRSLLASETNLPADLKVSGLHQAKRAAIIIVVLGLTWLFGILAVGEAKLLFQYLFCIFNSIQGLLVFTFYCLLSAETRAKYESLLCEKHSAGSTFETRFRHAGSYSVESGLNSRSMSSCASPNVVVVNVQLNPVTTNQ